MKNFFQVEFQNGNKSVKKVEIKQEDGTIDIGYEFEGYCSTNDIDRYGDIVDPKGIQKGINDYMKNPILLLQHDSDKPIGYTKEMKVDDKSVYIKGVVTIDRDNVFKALRTGVIRAMSIGFAVEPDDIETFEYEEDGEKKSGRKIKKWSIYENSLVSVPANANALIKNIGKETNFADSKLNLFKDSEYKSFFKTNYKFNYTLEKSIKDTLKEIEQKELDQIKEDDKKQEKENILSTNNNDMTKKEQKEIKYEIGQELSRGDNENQKGKVVEVIEEGEVNIEPSDQLMEASEENPVYVMENEDGKQAFYQDQLEEIEEEKETTSEEEKEDETVVEKKDTEDNVIEEDDDAETQYGDGDKPNTDEKDMKDVGEEEEKDEKNLEVQKKVSIDEITVGDVMYFRYYCISETEQGDEKMYYPEKTETPKIAKILDIKTGDMILYGEPVNATKENPMFTIQHYAFIYNKLTPLGNTELVNTDMVEFELKVSEGDPIIETEADTQFLSYNEFKKSFEKEEEEKEEVEQKSIQTKDEPKSTGNGDEKDSEEENKSLKNGVKELEEKSFKEMKELRDEFYKKNSDVLDVIDIMAKEMSKMNAILKSVEITKSYAYEGKKTSNDPISNMVDEIKKKAL